MMNSPCNDNSTAGQPTQNTSGSNRGGGRDLMSHSFYGAKSGHDSLAGSMKEIRSMTQEEGKHCLEDMIAKIEKMKAFTKKKNTHAGQLPASQSASARDSQASEPLKFKPARVPLHLPQVTDYLSQNLREFLYPVPTQYWNTNPEPANVLSHESPSTTCANMPEKMKDSEDKKQKVTKEMCTNAKTKQEQRELELEYLTDKLEHAYTRLAELIKRRSLSTDKVKIAEYNQSEKVGLEGMKAMEARKAILTRLLNEQTNSHPADPTVFSTATKCNKADDKKNELEFDEDYFKASMVEVPLGKSKTKTKMTTTAGKKSTRAGSVGGGGDRVEEVMEAMKKAILEDEFVLVENSDADEAGWETVEILGEGWEEIDKTLL